jgi:hypothetical protein
MSMYVLMNFMIYLIFSKKYIIPMSLNEIIFLLLLLAWCLGQLAGTSTNSTSPEINDHVSLQWP